MKEARAQALNQQVQRLLTNECVGLGLPGTQDSQQLQDIGFGLQLADICENFTAGVKSAGPASGGGAASLQGAAASILNRNLLRRMEEIRSEESESASSQLASAKGLLPNPFGGLLPTIGMSSGTASTVANTGTPTTLSLSNSRWHGLGLFATGQVEILNREIGTFQDGFNSNIFGFTAGADYRFSKAFVAGAAFTYANTKGEFLGGGNFSTNAYTGTLFASYLPTERTFIQTTAGITQNSYLIARPNRITIEHSAGEEDLEFNGISSSTSSGNIFNWSVLGGYDYSIRQFTVGPRVGLNYARTLINGYTEQGNTGLELTYQDQFIESFQSVLGVQATAPVSWRYGVLITQINADYIHEFANSQRFINVQFAQDGRNPAQGSISPGTDFSTQTPTRFAFQNDGLDRNWFNLGAGLVAVLPNGYQPFVNFRAMVGNSQFTNYVWTFGLRIEL
jgi:hypothetical protein